MIGTTVSHYVIRERLGGGGMGVVYKAEDTRLGRLVALKFLPPELTRDPVARQRFEQEARTASRLDHPQVCTIHEIDETPDGQVFICMALCEGETLKARLVRGALAIEETLLIAIQVADGLMAAHQQGIIHRDIKPANLIVGTDGKVKIVDFGLATLAGQARLTRSGVVVGTAMYMSPEQVGGHSVDHRTDLWSVGVVMYEMLTGQLPFASEHGLALVNSIMRAVFPPIEGLRTGVPPQLIAIVERCLRKEPAERYPSAAALCQDLRRVRRALSFSTVSTLGGVPPVSHEQRSLRRSLALPLLAAAVLAGAFLALPTVRQALRRSLGLGGSTEPRHMAVLEFANVGGDPANRAFCDGLAEMLASTLTQLEESSGSLWVVPMSEVRAKEVRSAGDARRVFGANFAVTGGVQRQGDQVRLALNLVDTRTLRQIRSLVLDERLADLASVEDRVVDALASMLDLGGRQSVPTGPSGGSRVSEAVDLYLQARGTLESVTGPPDAAKAVDLFKRAIALDPRYALAYAGLAEAYLVTYKESRDTHIVEEAIASCRRAEELDAHLVPVHVTLGLVHSATGRYEDAVTDFKRALASEPRNFDACFGLARALELQGKPIDAEMAHKRAIALRPDYWPGHNSLGFFYLRQGRYSEAEREYRKVIELTPENFWGYNNLGGLFQQLDKEADALAMYERALAIKPTYAIYSNVGTLYFHQGTFRQAAAMYEKALGLDDHDYALWGNLGTAYHSLAGEEAKAHNAYARAAALAEEARRLNPRDQQLLVDLAGYYGRLNGRAKGLALLETVIKANPGEADLMACIGMSFEDLGERERALEWIGKAIAAGFSRVLVERSPELAALRSDPRYRHLVEGHERASGKTS